MKRYIIPIFIPHEGCPHQCVFCDQRTITGHRPPPDAAAVAADIDTHLARLTEPRLVEIAFYGGSFTALPATRQEELLAPAKACLDAGTAHAIRLSTRPDAVDDAVTTRLKNYGVATVELGAQSLDDSVLAAAGRGHTAADVARAVAALRRAGLACGLQLMLGLPGEDWPSLIATTRGAVDLRPDFARIYPTVVIAGTPLADLYRRGAYRPLALSAAVARAAYLKGRFEDSGIPVIRTGLQATEELAGGAVVAGPYHPAFGEMVEAFTFRLMVQRLLERLDPFAGEKIVVRHNMRDTSAIRGLKNANTKTWQARYPWAELIFIADWPRRGELNLRHRSTNYVVNKTMLCGD
jgi:histone acetyltransferase (RNA polymerase elongator complex component)